MSEKWYEDAVFAPGDSDSVGANATPAFRLSAYFPYERGHPYTNTDSYEALFSCYRPAIEAHCDRVYMYANPGGKARRSKKIAGEDLEPFRYLRKQFDDVEEGVYAGFNFIDENDESAKGGKPFSFRFLTSPVIRLDACVSLDWFQQGKLDVEKVVDALLTIPMYGFVLGYGLSLSDDYASSPYAQLPVNLMPIAAKYSALDILQADMRRDAAGLTARNMEASPENYWIPGINWVTGAGTSVLDAVGGITAVERRLPAQVRVRKSENGAAFTLGPAPIAGAEDGAAGPLGLYRELGRALMPIGYPNREQAPDPLFGWHHHTESLDWVRRFYGPL